MKVRIGFVAGWSPGEASRPGAGAAFLASFAVLALAQCGPVTVECADGGHAIGDGVSADIVTVDATVGEGDVIAISDGSITDGAADASVSSTRLRVGPARVVAIESRTPLARQFSDGTIMLATADALRSSDQGQRWSVVSPGYRSGSWQLVVQSGTRVRAFATGGSSEDGCDPTWSTWLCFSSAAAGFLGSYAEYESPVGSAVGGRRRFRVGLPGDSTALWSVHEANVFDGRLYLVLFRYEQRSERWRGQIVPGAVVSSHLVVATDAEASEFSYVSEIASERTAPLAYAGPLPLYYGADPTVRRLNNGDFLAVLRTSADDDDGHRKLDPAAVFSASTTEFTDLRDGYAGRFAVRGVFEPALDAERLYLGAAPTPPLLIARSRDRGATWTRRHHAFGGTVAALAESEDGAALLLAYGGLEYPRRGHAIELSTDRGETFSERVVLDDAREGFTSGTVQLIATGPRRFLLLYDLLPGYIRPTPGSYRVLARSIDVVD